MIISKRLAALAMSITMIASVFTGCGDDEEPSASLTAGDNAESSEANESDESSAPASTGNMLNFTPPEKGEEIIVMTIKDHGDIKIKLFPEQASKGVENFATHAKDGYYDGLIFHRIINNFMIQGGDPLGTGMGGESIWGEKFDGGTSPDLNHVAGAVAYANSGSTATNGSQFYIVTGEKYSEAKLSQLEAQGLVLNDDAKKAYTEIGGAPWLDGGYTVFGQVFDGLDIVFELQGVETGDMDRPVNDVVIEKMTVEKYDGEDVRFYLSDY